MIGRPNVFTILLWELYILGSKCKAPWELFFMVIGEKKLVGQAMLNPISQELHVNIVFITTKCVLICKVISLDF